MKIDLEQFVIKEAPKTAYYIPDFVTKDEEASLLDKIDRTPQVRWTQLSNRRLQNWGGVPHPKGMIPEAIPDWLQVWVNKVNDLPTLSGFPANHVLLNEYLPGQGILPHFDGDLFHPVISTISLGSHTVLNFFSSEDGGATKQWKLKLFVEPRSLLILTQDMYTKYLHGIEEIDQDTIGGHDFANDVTSIIQSDSKVARGKRISLTIRHVPKTAKFKLKIG